MRLSFLALCLLSTWLGHADSLADIANAEVGGTKLLLDLHRPAKPNSPLIVYVHGGAWRSGSKEDVPIGSLVEQGFAIASVNYRLSTQARFPAQIHDIKAAIRFLRAKAHEFQINTERIAIAGSSAGGHLAALVGVSNENAVLEGKIGEHLDQSSSVQIIVSFYGASNLESILAQSTEFGLTVRVPALKLLLGGLPDEVPALARLASPVAHVDAIDPPLWLIHGDADPQMPPQQSEELARVYRKAGLQVQHRVLKGSKHGGDEFYDAQIMDEVAKFLLKGS